MPDETPPPTPEVDPETLPAPKKPSGAAQRKKAKQLMLVTVDDEAARQVSYDKIGEPDLENPDLLLLYARKALAVALEQVCKSRKLPITEKWRLIDKFTGTIGITQNRADLEARTARLEKLLKQQQQQASAVRIQTGASVKKPPTARGARTTPKIVGDDDSVT